VRRSCIALSVVLVALGPPAHGTAAGEWSPPVDGPIVRGYEPPATPFGPRHLGLDFGARPGTPVRAAGDGVVAFAGLVGRARAVGIEHPGARRTTYAYLRRTVVGPGTAVHRGDLLGFSGARGPRHEPDVVHFGYRVNGRPQDPAELFRAPRPRISLAPLDAPTCHYTGSQPGRPRLGIHTPAGSNGVRH
jgi:murein DD-endopeptidase MepM/ murein hydrolase activator NlpD